MYFPWLLLEAALSIVLALAFLFSKTILGQGISTNTGVCYQ
jgi:hypothetical protein